MATVKDATGTTTRGVEWLRPQPVKERSTAIRCADCGAEFRVTGEKFLRAMRDGGWRMRTTGEGVDTAFENVCGECAGPECW